MSIATVPEVRHRQVTPDTPDTRISHSDTLHAFDVSSERNPHTNFDAVDSKIIKLLVFNTIILVMSKKLSKNIVHVVAYIEHILSLSLLIP